MEPTPEYKSPKSKLSGGPKDSEPFVFMFTSERTVVWLYCRSVSSGNRAHLVVFGPLRSSSFPLVEAVEDRPFVRGGVSLASSQDY